MIKQILPRLREAGSRTWLRVLLAALLFTGAFATISPAQASETISTILGTVYLDTNGNGAIDGADVAAAGVSVMLTDASGAAVLDSNGVPIPPFVTNARGRYAFYNVRTDQTYRIVETPLAGYAPNLAVGPVANVVTESTSALVISTPTPTGVSTNYDSNNFLLVQPVQIAGNVYIDLFGTHVISPLDTLLSNPQVVLKGDFNGDGVADTAQAVVDLTGHYTFTSWTNPTNGQTQLIPPGTYQVVQTVASGYNAVDAFPGRAGDVKINITTLQVAATTPNTLYDNENFLIENVATPGGGGGSSLPGNLSLSGFVWYDLNGDALRAPINPVDPGLGGVLIRLTGTDAGGNSVTATTTTAADGSYTFQQLNPGTYTVAVDKTTLPVGLDTETFDGIGAVPDGLLDNKVIGTLTVANSPVSNVNFGYTGHSALGDTVWNDANGNGVLDAGEHGIAGVTVNLVWAGPDGVLGTSDDVVYAAQVTDMNGIYNFTKLPSGNFKVCVDAASPSLGQFIQTYDLDGLSTPNCAEVFNLGVGQTRTDVDFGYRQNGSMSGTLYVDANKNSVLDSGEAKLGGITVTLKDANGNTVATTTTAGDGTYGFSGLRAGTYKVCAPAIASGYALETAALLSVTVVGGQNTPNNNFGYIPVVPLLGSLSGVAYCDLNGDKTYNVGEPLLSGVLITLTKPDGSTATTTTGATGSYQFTSLPVGSYKVSAPVTTAGKTLVTSSMLTVTVVANQNASNNNFGYVTTNTSGNFTTFTQGGWGTAPRGSNPGALLVNNFTKVFGSAGVSIGGNYVDTFTSAAAAQNFLPQGGTPVTLSGSATNPTVKTNVFAGQVLALQLSVSFSNAGITRNGLSSQTAVSGALAGKTVAQILALANTVLGGNTAALAPYGLTLSGLNDIVTSINQNYDNGTTDNHYLH